ncbi:hypothetical protein [Campylobacter sp. 19-13652]|uniref:hypothetical protein n=1 Tax=Campylobacter sp. 19-13652 TaxID=2840180 RepID=UPI001C740B36|nr:hypothetical protein [Campylobacter sp. 19-13652]BCX78677.1 hypothetical protein LBC_01390 [Campylobacter sp. 19-13652]
MRLLAAFCLGYLMLCVASFVFFVGLWDGYFIKHGVDEYFNLIYIASQPWLAWAALALPLGWGLLYARFANFIRAIFVILLISCASTWYTPVALRAGFALFSSPKKLTLKDKIEQATLLYSVKGRSYYLLQNGKTVMIKQ